MPKYIIRRLLLVIPTVFLVSLVVFISVRLMPGDIVDLLLSEQGSVSVTAHREQIEALRQDYVRTAYAKGLRERTVIIRHAVKNAMRDLLDPRLRQLN